MKTTKASHQPASKKCVSYFAQQKLRISFCDVDVTFLHSKITTSCKILILHFLHCKTSLVFGDVGLMSHFCVTFVVQNLWGYLGGVPEDSVPCHIRRFASQDRPQRAGCCSSPRSRCKRARGDLIINSAKTVWTTCAWSGVVTRASCGTSQARSLTWQDGLVSPVQQVCEPFWCDGRRLGSCVPWQCVHFAKPW